METLKTNTVRGLFWSFLDSFGVYLVRFGFSIAIARTLSPEDYGLMGMIVIFISLGQMIMQSGFSMALIQKKDCTAADYCTAFWFNVITALIVYGILFFSAEAIAGFYGKPVLVNITRVAALGIILNSLGSVQVSILSREMDFRKLTFINLVGALFSGITGLFLALQGYEVWALVFQTLAGNFIYLLGLWWTGKWRPETTFSLKSFRSLFNFGSKIFLQGLTDVIFTKIYFPLIGKYFPAVQLGYYTNANRFYDIFIRQVSSSFNRVAFSAFTKIQDEKERFRANYIRVFHMLATFMFPGTVVLIISSQPFISIALTEKWLPAVPLMMAFFLEGFFFPILMFNQNILCSVGRSGLSLKIDILKKATAFISIFLLFRLGIAALILGQVFATALACVVSTVTVIKIQGIVPYSIIGPLIKILTILVVCILFNYFIIESAALKEWPELILKCTIIPVIFFGLSDIFKVTAISEIRSFLRDYKLLPLKK